MPFLVIAELGLRIWLRILETTPDAVLAEQATDSWATFKKVIGWFDRFLPQVPEP